MVRYLGVLKRVKINNNNMKKSTLIVILSIVNVILIIILFVLIKFGPNIAKDNDTISTDDIESEEDTTSPSNEVDNNENSTVPSIKIKNEENGTQYKVGILSFNLLSTGYTLVENTNTEDSETLGYIEYTLRNEVTNDFLLILEHDIDNPNADDIDELFYSFKDPLKYLKFKEQLDVEYYIGENKFALLHEAENDSFLYLNLNDEYYYTFAVDSEQQSETDLYMEIMRTANITQ